MNKSKDYIFSILSVILPLIVLQLILIPQYSKTVSQHALGNFILVITIINMSAAILGNSLNNIRLTTKLEIKNENKYFSFLIILILIQLFISSIVGEIFGYSIESKIYILLWSVFLIIKTYIYVYYRLILNYKNYLFSSIINSGMLLFGVLLVNYFEVNIYFIYCIAEGLTILYIFSNQKLIQKFKAFELLDLESIKNYLTLTISNILNNLVLYADRLLIGLVLGARYVPLFFIATTIGKMSNVMIGPIANVLLSYNVKGENKYIKKKEIVNAVKLIILVTLMTFPVYFASYLFIKYFYSNYFTEVKGIIWIANFAVILFSSTAIPQMKLIASNHYNSNLIINIFIIIGLFAGIPLMVIKGLEGFSILLILLSLIKFVLIYFNLFKNDKINV